MKSILSLMVCLASLLFATPILCAPMEIKFAHAYPEFTPVGQGAILFQKMVESRLRGKVKVEVYPAGKFGPTNRIMASLQSGEIQMAPLLLQRLMKFSTKYQIFELPFVFEDEGAVTRFQNSPAGRILLRLTENQGYKGLAFWHLGMRQFVANKPLLLPGDAKGLKFGVPRMVMPEIAYRKYKAIGAAPFPMDAGAVQLALQKKSIDGSESTWPMILRAKLYEMQKYISVTNHAYVGFVLTTNVPFWNRLQPEIQKELDSIISEVTKNVNRLAIEASYNAIAVISKLQPDRVKVLTAEERNRWRESMKPVWDKSESEIGGEVIQAAWRSGTAGGGDPCKLGTCRCPDKSCKKECCY
jgi:C4-dicarboxylate-binding protein DctP